MVFSHDTEDALQITADLVNTARPGVEALADVADLTRFGATHGFSSAAEPDGDVLVKVRSLRDRLRQVWTNDDLDTTVGMLNALIADSDARPFLTKHDDWDWHLHFTPLGSPLDRQLAAETAMALVFLVRHDELGRLKLCAGEGCDAVLVDLSRNRSKRYCDTGNCGNRANIAAYRSRLRAISDGAGR